MLIPPCEIRVEAWGPSNGQDFVADTCVPRWSNALPGTDCSKKPLHVDGAANPNSRPKYFKARSEFFPTCAWWSKILSMAHFFPIDYFFSIQWYEKKVFSSRIIQLMPIPIVPVQSPSSGFRSKIRKVFRTSSNSDKATYSLVSQLTSAALCASSPVLPKPGEVPPVVKSFLRPLSVPQLRYIKLFIFRNMEEGTNFFKVFFWVFVLMRRLSSVKKSDSNWSRIRWSKKIRNSFNIFHRILDHLFYFQTIFQNLNKILNCSFLVKQNDSH